MDFKLKENLIVQKMENRTDMTWKDIQDAVGDYSCCLDTFIRRAQGIYEAYKSTQTAFEDCSFESDYFTDPIDVSVNSLDCDAINRLQIERDKLRTEKLEISKWHRETAREELFYDNIVRAISANPLPVRPKRIVLDRSDRSRVLLIADQHYGTEFKIKGVDGTVINEYSPEIFEERMWILFEHVVEMCEKENISTLKICSLGDSLDGLLRFSQLAKLRWGVIESAVYYAQFMVKWLDELSKYVRIQFYNVQGNHTEMRLLDGKKGQLERENIDIAIIAIMEAYLQNNANIEIIKNESGHIFFDVVGFNIFGYHGEDKNLATAAKDFANFYDVNIDYIIAGHLHHLEGANTGARKGNIRAGSIMGTNDFSTKIKRRADSTAHMLTFEGDKGLVRIDNFILN